MILKNFKCAASIDMHNILKVLMTPLSKITVLSMKDTNIPKQIAPFIDLGITESALINFLAVSGFMGTIAEVIILPEFQRNEKTGKTCGVFNLKL